MLRKFSLPGQKAKYSLNNSERYNFNKKNISKLPYFLFKVKKLKGMAVDFKKKQALAELGDDATH